MWQETSISLGRGLMSTPSTVFYVAHRPPSPYHVSDVVCLAILRQNAHLLSNGTVTHALGRACRPKPIHLPASRPFVLNSPFIKPPADISMPTIAATKTAAGPTSATDAAAFTQQQIAQELNNNFNPLPVYSKTPVNTKHLRKELISYPDQVFVDNLIHSFQHGFSIGYSGPEFCNIAPNLQSASLNSTAIFNCIYEELKQKRMSGPFTGPPLQNFRTSPIGVIPKKDSNKFRMITDLSSPKSISINDFINDSEASVSFNNFDSAVSIVSSLGRGALMAKLDIKSAFRICPVRQEDWHYLGFSFLGFYFVDLCLPFGLRSSVERFTQLSDTLLWIMKNNCKIANCTHYLDDFYLAGPPSSPQCEDDMQKTIALFKNLGVPLAPEKIEGPVTNLTFLGIEIDSQTMSIRLPEEKLSALISLLQKWSEMRKCTKRELLSLIGKLSFASKVIPSGRMFVRRLIDLSMTVERLSHRISLNSEARKDISWWANYLPAWNGRYKILDSLTTPCHQLHIYTDASGEIGLGIYNNGKWVSKTWPKEHKQKSIQWKEIFPVYVCCYLWGKEFQGKRLLFHCDNLAVVNIWSAQSCKSPEIMAVLRKLFYIAAQHEFTVHIKHIPGVNNVLADCLSRSQISKFFTLAPLASSHPTEVPDELWRV